MKWFLFFAPYMLLFSCKNEDKQKAPQIIRQKQINYNDTVIMPSSYDSEVDSGYFKGYIPEKLDNIEFNDTTHLSRFLSNIISRKDIILLSDQTLSHSVFINQRNKTRLDTLRNKSLIIISTYHFGEKESQSITFNGDLLKNYTGTGNNIMGDDFIDFDEGSFRHFSFNGEEYYYIRAFSFYHSGTSMGNLSYHLFYSFRNKELNCFETCRFSKMLFGDVNGDENLDYLDFNNTDFCTSVPLSDSVKIQLYSCNVKGKFILQKDFKGKPYYIDGNTGDSFSQDSFIVRKFHWFRPLK